MSLKYMAVRRPFFLPLVTFRPCALHSSACTARASSPNCPRACVLTEECSFVNIVWDRQKIAGSVRP